MTTSAPRPPTPPEMTLLLHAYVDGELDPANALAIEQRLAADPALAAELARIEALRQALRERLPREAPSPGLRSRIESALRLQRAAAPSWRALAASVALFLLVASSATWLLIGPDRSASTADAVVDAHIRALIAPQSTDVLSSDRQTVKPWFSGRIAQAPRVVDLAGAGFPLAGGRIDVIGRSPAATIVYRRRQHVISVTATAAPGRAKTEPVRTSVAGGYSLVTWSDNGFAYWAVSDLNGAELEQFAELFCDAPADQ
jgi:anti-sigma factor RsiW